GLNPIVDSHVLRCPIPELSKERRQELVKVASNMAEEGRVSVRNARRDGLDALKKAQKDKVITEDDLKRFDKEVQQITDRAIKEINDHLTHKEKELMEL
ncbi:MAG TPA: ribosome recycling factor, partial [Opitutae bacterium]|nr:ribosome recycling factor [Opitutae bacterium]